MSKRKSDDGQTAGGNPWAKLDRDEKGLLKDVHIRLLQDFDDELDEGQEEKNGTNAEGNGTAASLICEKQKFGFFQGKSYNYHKKRLPFPSGSPAEGITGFQSISLDGMQDWEGGIDKEVLDFLKQVSPLVARDEGEERKFCLGISLPFAFKGNQAANFGKNLDQLLSVPGIEESIGAMSYSEGGHLAEMLARFPRLAPDPKFLYRYDIHVYAENDTLVEDYYADLEHWLLSQWAKPPPNNGEMVRQARLKFVHWREDQAKQMLELLKENFYKASSSYSDAHTFTIRLDCPGFSLEPFHIENNKSSEIMAMEFKEEKVLKEDADVDDFGEEGEGPEAKRGKSGEQGNGAGEDGGGKEEEELTVWKSYKLVRARDGKELERLMPGQLPLIKRRININH